MRKKLILTILIFLFTFITPAFGMFKLPSPVGYVNDFANIIENTDENRLNSIILELKQKTQAEVVVVTLSSLKGYPVEDVGLEIGRQWKVGQKGKNSGVIVLVAPNDRKIRIETGYGIEGVIPDSKAGRIRDELMLPMFRTGNYSKGIVLGTAAIVDTIAKDNRVTISDNYNYQNYFSHESSQDNPLKNLVLLAIFLFLLIKPYLEIKILLMGNQSVIIYMRRFISTFDFIINPGISFL